jgi:putative MFS transporter
MVGGVFYACQVTPYYALSIFLPQIFKQFNMNDPYTSGLVFYICMFFGVLLGTWLIDKITRRLFLVGSFYTCAAVLTVLIVLENAPAIYALLSLSIFSFLISAAVVLEFAYTPELFPTELRASGVGFSVACSQVGGVSGTFLLPVLMGSFGTQAVMAGGVSVLLIGGIVCQMFAPETGRLKKVPKYF